VLVQGESRRGDEIEVTEHAPRLEQGKDLSIK
jgi:hypothetical protein